MKSYRCIKTLKAIKLSFDSEKRTTLFTKGKNYKTDRESIIFKYIIFIDDLKFHQKFSINKNDIYHYINDYFELVRNENLKYLLKNLK